LYIYSNILFILFYFEITGNYNTEELIMQPLF
ncbi:unnamed protein product, partial [marine sediment metagenome]